MKTHPNIRGNLFLRPSLAALFLMAVILFGFGCGSDGDGGSSNNDSVSLVILQTSDVHHHASGFGPALDYTPLDSSDNDGVKGGYARLAGLIKKIRSDAASDNKKVLLFDSGDFMMGTVYDLTRSDPLAFQFMSRMQYDAITLGNHEFDWGVEGLSALFESAISAGFDVPVVATNLVTSDTDTTDDDIESLTQQGVIVSEKIISVTPDLKVGVLGILGIDAHSVAPLVDPITFDHDEAFFQAKVDDIRSRGADIVVLLSHTGITSEGEGEDMDIAGEVTGIDVIASGHMHTATHALFTKEGTGTLIFSPGAYGSYLSRLDITWKGSEKKITDHSFSLIAVDDSVAGDEEMDDLVHSYQDVANEALADLGVTTDSIISKTGFDLKMVSLEESGFGDLIADAIRNAATILDVNDTKAFDVGVIASGVIRDAILTGETGNISFSDVYNALPLGFSPYGDSTPGYPMMSVYVTAKEIRNICEISVSAAPLMGSDFYLNFSGIRYDYNASNAILSKVTDVYLCDTSDVNTVTVGTRLDLTDETTLYRLVVNLYALSMMDIATSYGLAIIPKTKTGDPVLQNDFSDIRIDISADQGVQELKEWMALQYFLETYYPSSGEGISASLYGENGAALDRYHDVSVNE